MMMMMMIIIIIIIEVVVVVMMVTIIIVMIIMMVMMMIIIASRHLLPILLSPLPVLRIVVIATTKMIVIVKTMIMVMMIYDDGGSIIIIIIIIIVVVVVIIIINVSRHLSLSCLLSQYYERLAQRVSDQRDRAEEERMKELTKKLHKEKEEALMAQWEECQRLQQQAVEAACTALRAQMRHEFEKEKEQAIDEALRAAAVSSL